MKMGHPADALIPPGLLAEIKAAAAKEHRPARELVGEAVERYLSQRRWFRRDKVHVKIAQGLNRCGRAGASMANPSWPS